ncbi:hypothetical protein [Methanobacterium spitsbergense]|uniref:Uncharacterized protein n=1 Tax=Methanobacterium spitsbergense TaxID=2874285 RepID=A0A8T5UQZ3_9EURY|nr:hypothetical protein [Methanobacterium spitsbergense]MBZ2166178.1 hypothetical protein [Methanobacterium spitsbergense]
MINLLVTVFGGLLFIAGFYGMSFGFSTPPNFGLFFGGLCSSVFGIIMMVFFSSKIDLSRSKTSKPKNKIPKQAPKPVTGKAKKGAIEKLGQNIKPPAKPAKSSKKIKPVKTKPISADDKKPIIPSKSEKEKPMKKITPVTSRPVPKKVNQTSKEVLPKSEKTFKTTTPPELSMEKPKKKAPISQATEPKVDVPPIKPVLLKESADEKPDKKEKIKPVPKHIDVSKLKSSKSKEKDEQEFVKNRLDRLKENYIKNAKDIESIIDERLDSFKGTLDTLKSESQEPSIIWSFDAGDVQDALKDTISKADNKILMMYPWIRNIDVSILKKFMDTESRMIIQEASLDDDTSVELIKLLIGNKVEIRTMPHIHTVAVVSDNTNGLIISTDPIYESFEVGVMYKDQKSIEEIERLFEDAWEISKDLDMEIRK